MWWQGSRRDKGTPPTLASKIEHHPDRLASAPAPATQNKPSLCVYYPIRYFSHTHTHTHTHAQTNIPSDYTCIGTFQTLRTHRGTRQLTVYGGTANRQRGKQDWGFNVNGTSEYFTSICKGCQRQSHRNSIPRTSSCNESCFPVCFQRRYDWFHTLACHPELVRQDYQRAIKLFSSACEWRNQRYQL